MNLPHFQKDHNGYIFCKSGIMLIIDFGRLTSVFILGQVGSARLNGLFRMTLKLTLNLCNHLGCKNPVHISWQTPNVANKTMLSNVSLYQ